jgi:hypothetical protein
MAKVNPKADIKEDGNWQTPSFRQSMVKSIADAIRVKIFILSKSNQTFACLPFV